MYSGLDAKGARRRPDPFGQADLRRSPASPGVRVLPALSPSIVPVLVDLDLDVALDLGFAGLRPLGVNAARYGVWCFAGGHRLDSAAGSAEVMANVPAVASELHAFADGDADGVETMVLCRSWSRTERSSPWRTAQRLAWKSSRLLERALRHLYQLGSLPRATDGGPGSGPHTAIASAPSGLQTARFLPRLAARLARAGLRRLLSRKAWSLAYQLHPTSPIPEQVSTFTRLTPPRDRFWADPFPVVDGDTCCIFVEEWKYGVGKGRIAVLQMDTSGSWRRLGTALEQSYHLSYPFVFEWEGSRFMIPETSHHGAVELYRCVSYPLQWELSAALLDGVRAADVTLESIEGRWWMFVNQGDEGISTYDELHLYHADTPLGPWVAHPCNPVISDVRRARPAGRLFRWRGTLYRPSQDCAERYGHAIVVNEVLEVSPEAYEEKPVCTLDPESMSGINRMHTLNTVEWLSVIDCHRDRWWPG